MTANYWKKWVKSAAVRALKTTAQTAVSMLTGNLVGVLEVDWIGIASVAAMAGIVSVLTSVAGLPEVKMEGVE